MTRKDDCLDPKHGHVERCPNCGFIPGGGRESGGEATYEAGVGTLPTAAANPAVESLADFIIPKVAVNPAARTLYRKGSSKTLCPICSAFDTSIAHQMLHERIRELEAELEKTRYELGRQWGRAERAEARAEKAEALLRDASMQIRLMRDHNDEQKARVKELETIVKGKFTTLGEILHARESRSSPARKE